MFSGESRRFQNRWHGVEEKEWCCVSEIHCNDGRITHRPSAHEGKAAARLRHPRVLGLRCPGLIKLYRADMRQMDIRENSVDVVV